MTQFDPGARSDVGEPRPARVRAGTTVIFRCPGCGTAFSSLAFADVRAAYEAHRRFGPEKCRG